MRKHSWFTLFCALVLLVGATLTARADTQVLEGRFVGVEQGDYLHLNVLDEKGKEKSFWVIQGGDNFDPFIENPDDYKGKKVRVTWHKVKQNIPEAGGEMTIEEATDIELVK